MKEPEPFDVIEVRSRPVPRLDVLGVKRARTLEGRLAGTPLVKSFPVAAACLAVVTLAELVTTYVRPAIGITLHAVTLFAIVTHAALVRRLAPDLARLLVAISPLPLIRIASLTSPLAQFSYLQWFTILSVILYSGIVTAVKLLKTPLPDLGLRLPALRHVPLEIVVILSGFGLGYIEYHILRPSPLVPDLTLRSLGAPMIVFFVSTGLLEEVLFRGLIQTYANRALGVVVGVAFSALTFAVLHVGWQSWVDVIFVGTVGLYYSLVVLRTRSIVGVSISHALTNTMLFLVMPLVAGR